MQTTMYYQPAPAKPTALFAKALCVGLIATLVSLPALTTRALDQAQLRINTAPAQGILGTGTGVVVGVLDNGVDINHPALAGTDTNGNLRLVAQANFVNDGWNSTDDSTGHGTAVAGILLGDSTVFPGASPDARYITARVSDLGLTSTTSSVINGLDFAFANGANIFNLSLNEASGGSNDGSSKLSHAVDYYVSALGIPVVVSAGNFGLDANPEPTSPADAYNAITVGASVGPDYDLVYNDSAFGPTGDGRSKPDIVAPGTNIAAAFNNWEGPAFDYANQTGTSFSTPMVTGLLTNMLSFGFENSLNTSPLVLKATLLNAAEKIAPFNAPPGNVWSPGLASFNPEGVFTVTQPLNRFVGAGQVDALATAKQYAAGEYGPGSIPDLGWDFNFLGENFFTDYELGLVEAGSNLSATLTFHRQVGRFDEVAGSGAIDAADDFLQIRDLANLDLLIFRNGELLAQSIAAGDSVEHLALFDLLAGQYTLRVSRPFVNGVQLDEPFAIAWELDRPPVVPEPALGMAVMLAMFWGSSRRRRLGRFTSE